jgi:hypothetical protein
MFRMFREIVPGGEQVMVSEAADIADLDGQATADEHVVRVTIERLDGTMTTVVATYDPPAQEPPREE